MKIIYVSSIDNRSWSTSQEAFEGMTYPVVVDESFSGGAMTYHSESGEWIIDPPIERTHEDDVYDAISMVSMLKSEAAGIVSMLDLDFRLGDISDDELIKLRAWRKYMKSLDLINTDEAPNIEYPDKPE